MTSQAASELPPVAAPLMTTGPNFTELLKLAEPRGDRLLLAGLLALAAHGALGFYAVNRPYEAPRAPAPVEVEFAFREPPPPPPQPAPTPEAPEPPPAAAAPKVAPTELPPPPAARAGAVLTALPDPATPPAAAEPFDFTSDPNSTVYGSGVVAVGGTQSHGLAGARVGGEGVAPVPAPPSGNGLTPLSDLTRRPGLRVSDPCRGFFPDAARADLAQVSVRVVIGKTGRVSNASIVTESPKGQGFGAAARACMLDQEFTPALDREGNPAATALAVNVRFSR